MIDYKLNQTKGTNNMKRLLLAVPLMMALNAPAQSQVSKFCNDIYELSRQVMSARQNGVSLPEMLNLLAKIESGSMYKPMIIHAFELSIYSTDEYKQSVIDEFSNEYLLQCLKLEEDSENEKN